MTTEVYKKYTVHKIRIWNGMPAQAIKDLVKLVPDNSSLQISTNGSQYHLTFTEQEQP